MTENTVTYWNKTLTQIPNIPNMTDSDSNPALLLTVNLEQVSQSTSQFLNCKIRVITTPDIIQETALRMFGAQ